MQTVTDQFNEFAQGQVRPLAWDVRASFSKEIDDTIQLFTLDESVLDGDDLLAPSDNSVINFWDQYEYVNLSDRVISVEVESEQTEPYSVVQSMADVVLSNHDGYFTPNSGSEIDQFILPRRPFKIQMGFGSETIPMFVGLSTRMPEIDKASRTVRFHCIDFLSFLFEKPIDQTITLLDNNTGEILEYLFDFIGLLPDQYNIDPTSFNRIPYFYVEKNATLGKIIRELMEAEQGRLWLDEVGIIRYLNRQNYPDAVVYEFDQHNTVDYQNPSEEDVINDAVIHSDVLAVVETQKIWESAGYERIPAGESLEIWANLEDAQVNIQSPSYEPSEVQESYFSSFTDESGTIPYADIVLDSIDKFSTSAKMVFTNEGSSVAYIRVVLWGDPVKVVDSIDVEEKDAASIADLEQRRYTFNTRYIQTRDNAVSKASMIVQDYKDVGSILDIEVKGNMALQIADGIDANIDSYTGTHYITKIINSMSRNGFVQKLRVKRRIPVAYFILNESLLDGDDVLSP